MKETEPYVKMVCWYVKVLILRGRRTRLQNAERIFQRPQHSMPSQMRKTVSSCTCHMKTSTPGPETPLLSIYQFFEGDFKLLRGSEGMEERCSISDFIIQIVVDEEGFCSVDRVSQVFYVTSDNSSLLQTTPRPNRLYLEECESSL